MINLKSALVLCSTVLGFTLVSGEAIAQTYVGGYYRSNGTYVKPHYRSRQNSTQSDNYSTYGNYNPYTGKKGYKTCGLYGSC